MEITCYKCKNTYEVPAGAMLSYKAQACPGIQGIEIYPVPTCGVMNAVMAHEFRSNDIPQAVIPVTGTPSRTGHSDKEQSSLENKAACRCAP